MAGQETRMLLLGAVCLFEPVNGYQIRRELLSWQVDRWAHTNPGSIYHGLTRLTRDGLLTRHDLHDNGREVAVYECTHAGREELGELQVASLETVDSYDRAAFQVAFSMLPLLDRVTALAALRTRQRALREAEGQLAAAAGTEQSPPHAQRVWGLWLELLQAERRWLDGVVDDVADGTLRFRPDEDWGWTPPADDPGRQMAHDQERYRALLGR